MVLDKMSELNMISQSDYDTAIADDVYAEIKKVSSIKKSSPTKINSYYIDEVINQLKMTSWQWDIPNQKQTV